MIWHQYILQYVHAFVAQGLEHWSCKPGVESSNLSEGFLNEERNKTVIVVNFEITTIKSSLKQIGKDNTWETSWCSVQVMRIFLASGAS